MINRNNLKAIIFCFTKIPNHLLRFMPSSGLILPNLALIDLRESLPQGLITLV